jgi:6,7-dimethyl-8-ribityllumazine synthase
VDEDAQPDASSEPEPEPEWEEGPEPVTDIAPEPERPGDESELVDTEPDVEPEAVEGEPAQAPEPAAHGAWEHAPGELTVPPGFPVLEGLPLGERRSVGVVVGRFNGEVTTRLLESALDELTARGVSPSSVTVMPVPGAFELPLAAMALAKTRRFACVVALGCVIRGDTPHFDYVASEAASGLQLAAIETGVPVAFGVLTLDRADQAEARIEKGAEAVRTALEMADLFANLRAAAAR